MGVVVGHKPFEGQDEDAPPLELTVGDHVAIGVFDGIGGSGNKRYRNQSEERSGAYLGSRIVRDAIFKELKETAPQYWPHLTGSKVDTQWKSTEALFAAASGRVQSARQRWHAVDSMVTNQKAEDNEWPTTMACAIIDQKTRRLSALWQGDSRVYALSVNTGLQALSLDGCNEHQYTDIVTPDGYFEDLTTPGLSVSRRWAWRQRTLDKIDDIVAVICMTDGVYQPAGSVMELERLLVAALCHDASDAAFKHAFDGVLREGQSRANADDASYAVWLRPKAQDSLRKLRIQHGEERWTDLRGVHVRSGEWVSSAPPYQEPPKKRQVAGQPPAPARDGIRVVEGVLPPPPAMRQHPQEWRSPQPGGARQGSHGRQQGGGTSSTGGGPRPVKQPPVKPDFDRRNEDGGWAGVFAIVMAAAALILAFIVYLRVQDMNGAMLERIVALERLVGDLETKVAAQDRTIEDLRRTRAGAGGSATVSGAAPFPAELDFGTGLRDRGASPLPSAQTPPAPAQLPPRQAAAQGQAASAGTATREPEARP